MLRLTKKTDYGIVLLAHMAAGAEGVHTARDLAAEARLPAPIVTKILQSLAVGGLLESHRGVKGGFTLARTPETISMANILEALEGPVAITECSLTPHGLEGCDRESFCVVRTHTQVINHHIWQALQRITLADLSRPAVKPITHEGPLPSWIAATPALGH